MAEDTSRAKPTRKPGAKKADGMAEVLANIAGMPEPDRVMAERFRAIIERTAPSLAP